MKVKRSKFDIVVNILSLIMLVGVAVYLAVSWIGLPDKIPGHYNALGQVDRWGSKGELLFTPIVSWILFLGITLLERFPHIWNTGVAVTEENREQVYRILKSLIGTVKLLIVAVFAFISVNMMSAHNLPLWFIPVFLVLMFGSIIYFIVKLVRVK